MEGIAFFTAVKVGAGLALGWAGMYKMIDVCKTIWSFLVGS